MTNPFSGVYFIDDILMTDPNVLVFKETRRIGCLKVAGRRPLNLFERVCHHIFRVHWGSCNSVSGSG